MSVGTRLLVNVLVWTASVPALNLLLITLDRNRMLPLSGHVVAAVAAAFVTWAGWIYWHCVPHAARMLERGAYLVAFALAMLLAGAVALFATFWSTVAIYGF